MGPEVDRSAWLRCCHTNPYIQNITDTFRRFREPTSACRRGERKGPIAASARLISVPTPGLSKPMSSSMLASIRHNASSHLPGPNRGMIASHGLLFHLLDFLPSSFHRPVRCSELLSRSVANIMHSLSLSPHGRETADVEN